MGKFKLLLVLGFFLIALNVQAATLPTLDVCKETAHLKIYCTEQDASCLDDVAAQIEAKYAKISSDLACSLDKTIQISIYPDLSTYHMAIGYPEAPDWMVGNADDSGDIKMVSPRHPGSAHDYQSMLYVAVHEVTHAFAVKVNPGIPLWLNEGLAVFEADQMDAGRRRYVVDKVSRQEIPKFDELGADSLAFGAAGGYQWSYTIVAFAVNTFGIQKLPQWLRNGGDFQQTFNISEEEFWTQWVNYLKTAYVDRSQSEGIKEIGINEIYWSNDVRLKGLAANKPHSLFLETDLGIDNLRGEQLTDFIKRAGYEFELTAAGKAKITALLYEGNIYPINGRRVLGFWISVSEDEFRKLEKGIVYQLAPKIRNGGYQWVMKKDMTVELT